METLIVVFPAVAIAGTVKVPDTGEVVVAERLQTNSPGSVKSLF
ncbi:hypothetical protein JCM19302_477 [Jejuia pallidilutea]|uniref:Uncharacterized protein n=1 Tax=Jejuia pallidilutea TaxID=504487 RepID=A0A090W4P4_9FLAO|nr:hypothetical protein JCM19302_477 [Jejuia pallidilutea]